jgi:predicted RNA-binding protein with PUA-like domain
MKEGNVMAYWLFKSEPDSWSWEDQKAKGEAGEEWDGVRNYQARNYMRSMKKGDLGFFYHSGAERRIVGIVEVAAKAHPDSTDSTGTWECVDIKAVRDLPRPVPLDEIKRDERLGNMVLVKNSRLSVQPVAPEEWSLVCTIGGLDPSQPR